MVHYLRQERLGQKFEMLPDELQHATEVLDLLFALTKDFRFKAAILIGGGGHGPTGGRPVYGRDL